ncbi:MAG: polyprenyl synthetase family protein [Actinomycetota bacterium]|nr:polyprenyl synthetase family protein [Actinomycetota bacterium]
MDKLPRIFNRYKPYIEEQLKSSLQHKQLPFYDMLRYHMGWVDSEGREIETSGGKYLRATLCLLASESLSSDFKPALPLAEAIEYIHNFSLVHDDIQDNGFNAQAQAYRLERLGKTPGHKRGLGYEDGCQPGSP